MACGMIETPTVLQATGPLRVADSTRRGERWTLARPFAQRSFNRIYAYALTLQAPSHLGSPPVRGCGEVGQGRTWSVVTVGRMLPTSSERSSQASSLGNTTPARCAPPP